MSINKRQAVVRQSTAFRGNGRNQHTIFFLQNLLSNDIISIIMKLSKITIFVGLWIFVSATFMRQLLDLFIKAAGPVYAFLYIKIILLILGLIFILFLISRKSLTVPRLMIVSILITFGFIFIQQLTIVVEKIHILEYCIFGWLVCRDLIRDKSLARGVFLSCAG